ncbi:hypothetical protein BDZ89DRAFT_948988 [Hymenopellis radicata]|nr:hypothetical protein BDZ89DRAFT_948988 [Hymenopellis radicata]
MLASCIPTDDTYLKLCAPFCVDPTEDVNDFGPASDVLSEVAVCEQLSKYPHPNIAEYRGVLQENGVITALCFKKYGSTLSVAYESGELDAEKVMVDIMNGLDHLHKHGFVHCDLNPSNILMDHGAAVIIDFDSCRRLGASMRDGKGSTFPWEVTGPPTASPQHDLLAAKLILHWLKTGEKPDPDL